MNNKEKAQLLMISPIVPYEIIWLAALLGAESLIFFKVKRVY